MNKICLFLTLVLVGTEARVFYPTHSQNLFTNEIVLPTRPRSLLTPLSHQIPRNLIPPPHSHDYTPKKKSLINPLIIYPEQPPSTGVAPLNPHSITQYSNQDNHGRYNFGYDGETSSRFESKDADGTVRGSFSYIDPYGELQSQNYIADEFGFRVSGTNLPVGPARKKRSIGVFPASTGPLFRHPQVYNQYNHFPHSEHSYSSYSHHEPIYSSRHRLADYHVPSFITEW